MPQTIVDGLETIETNEQNSYSLVPVSSPGLGIQQAVKVLA